MRSFYVLVLLNIIFHTNLFGQSNYSQFVKKGAESYQAKDYSNALIQFTKALRLNPNDTLSALYGGITAQQLNRNESAIDLLETYVRNGGKDPSVFYGLAQLYRAKSDFGKAVNTLERGLIKNPSNKDLEAEIININVASGDEYEAIKGLEELTAKDPSNVLNWVNLAILYDNVVTKTVKAINELEPNLSQATFPEKAKLETRLAGLKQKYADNQSKALTANTKSIELDPSNYDANFNLGVIYYNRAVELKKVVDDMTMAEYKLHGKEKEEIVHGCFKKALPYFKRAKQTRNEDEVNTTLTNLESVISQFESKGVRANTSYDFFKQDEFQPAPFLSSTSTNLPVSKPITQGTASKESARPATSQSSLPNRCAFIIGNSTYQYGSQLQGRPLNDARDISARLKELGFQVTLVTDATKAQLENALGKFSKQAQLADVALFFFAGHGIESEGINFLIPIDAKLEDPEDARLQGISLDLVLSEMKRYQTKVNLVYLDACRDNPFRSWSRGGNRSFTQVGRLAQSTKVYYATQPGDVAQNGNDRNGIFTKALLNHLIKGAEIEDVMREVTIEVMRLTNQKQLPYSAGTLLTKFDF
jgi:tetratricopeptide (TPR) repeat protein